MPDLVTHVSAAYFLRKPLRTSKYTAIFFAGTILPDILTRPFYIIFPGAYWFVYPLHTPFILILVCVLISYFFEEKYRKTIFLTLLAAVFLHLILDLFQKNLNGITYWLFPISDMDIGVGLFWLHDSLYAMPFLAIGAIAVEIISFSRKRRNLTEEVVKVSDKK